MQSYSIKHISILKSCVQAWDQLALFDEYLELVIQYGFITMFSASFPLAPFWALINNIMEVFLLSSAPIKPWTQYIYYFQYRQVRIDAYKYTTQIRRPKAQKVENIGAWLGILKVITFAAVVLNVKLMNLHRTTFNFDFQAVIIAFTSEFMQRLYYKYFVSPDNTYAGYVDFTFTGIIVQLMNI